MTEPGGAVYGYYTVMGRRRRSRDTWAVLPLVCVCFKAPRTYTPVLGSGLYWHPAVGCGVCTLVTDGRHAMYHVSEWSQGGSGRGICCYLHRTIGAGGSHGSEHGDEQR